MNWMDEWMDWGVAQMVTLPPDQGHFTHEAKRRDHDEVVRAQKEVSKGHRPKHTSKIMECGHKPSSLV